MGKIIHIDKIRAYIKDTIVFRSKDIEVLTKNGEYSHLILHKLAKKGEIKRVVKGWYSRYDDPIVTVFCFKPSYIGLQEALSLQGLWEQETNVTIITPLRVRTGIRNVLESNIVLHSIDKRYFFGYEYLKYGDFFIPVSDIEKTLIDLIYFNEIPDKEIIRELRKKIDKKKLQKYLIKYSQKARKRIRDKIQTN
ncbi:MAG: hypothetical protein QXJ17_06260 [Nitrososphaeria archaeon]